MINLRETYTKLVKQHSHRLGFDFCGIAKAEKLDDDARRLEQWLSKGFQGSMSYMERNFDLRIDPKLLVPGAKSVITLMMNYYPPQQQDSTAPKIAKYAYGKDYHDIIRNKLKELLIILRQEIGEIEGRGFVDSAPVLERTWATRSGLGWIGKNANLIQKQSGSFFFIATLITDLDLIYDNPFVKDYCGTCTKCIDSCPTDAIVAPTLIDGSKCISYLTIELKDEIIPNDFKSQMQGWMFGCDVCQDVCPWNRFSSPHSEEGLEALPEILHLNTDEWKAMDEDTFKMLFRYSPLKRSKWKGIIRNLNFIKNE